MFYVFIISKIYNMLILFVIFRSEAPLWICLSVIHSRPSQNTLWNICHIANFLSIHLAVSFCVKVYIFLSYIYLFVALFVHCFASFDSLSLFLFLFVLYALRICIGFHFRSSVVALMSNDQWSLRIKLCYTYELLYLYLSILYLQMRWRRMEAAEQFEEKVSYDRNLILFEGFLLAIMGDFPSHNA